MRTFFILVIALTFVGCDQKKTDTETEVPKNVEPEIVKPETVAEKPEANDVPTSATKTPQPMPDDMKSGEKKKYGGEFKVEGDPVTLASVIKKGGAEEPVKVSGQIHSVCKKKGCWFKLTGPDVEKEIRVRMKDYGFFVPKNADGGDAVVEGTLKEREIPQDEAQHYADDAVKAGEKPEKVDGPQKVYEFTATAVEISKT